jgi:siroheme synthase-like protein
VNREVARAAEERQVFVNAVDDADSASAYLGGVLRKGGVTVAVSTDGRAPALAGLLREALEAVLPDDLGAWVRVAQDLRAQWKAAGIPIPQRRPLLLRALIQLYREAA